VRKEVDVPAVAMGGGRQGTFVALVECTKEDVEHLVFLWHYIAWLSGREARWHVADPAVLSRRIAGGQASRGSHRKEKICGSWRALVSTKSCDYVEPWSEGLHGRARRYRLGSVACRVLGRF
jgi:hypothetical protein